MENEKRNASETACTVTRRDFVKASAAAISVGAIASPGWANIQGSDRIRVGLVGCGGRGTGAASQALNADPGVVLTAMGDLFGDRISASLGHLTNHAGDRVDVPPERRFLGFDAHKHVLDNVDVIILTTPPHFRPMQLKAAIDAGKHVFAEKPMAVDAPGVRSVLASAAKAKRKGLSLMSGFCWRYSFAERAMFKKLHAGAIGDITSMHTTYHTGPLHKNPRQAGWSDMEFQLRNWVHFTWLSGDHIVEQACHAVDWINWAMDGLMPIRATALGGRQMREGPETGNVYDHFAVIYEYENGARCFHTCRQMPHCSGDNTAYVMGTKGKCSMNPWSPAHVITGENPWRYEGDRPNMYQVEHDELFAAIRAGTPVNDGVFMANSTMMSILGRTAAYSGGTVMWDEALASAEDYSPSSYEMGDLPFPPVPVPGQPSPVAVPQTDSVGDGG
ncbi:MAG: Gfo/Idh/MocA family oxidoreductase [Phycisphaerales bacterium]|nr:Gfo/Idh/MocA family oxidoreductase [Phycisphaerales bacterium]